MQADAALQAQEEERHRLRSERMHRANRAAAAARAAIKVGTGLPFCSRGPGGLWKGRHDSFDRQGCRW